MVFMADGMCLLLELRYASFSFIVSVYLAENLTTSKQYLMYLYCSFQVQYPNNFELTQSDMTR
jgi:hypothetical protein